MGLALTGLKLQTTRRKVHFSAGEGGLPSLIVGDGWCVCVSRL